MSKKPISYTGKWEKTTLGLAFLKHYFHCLLWLSDQCDFVALIILEKTSFGFWEVSGFPAELSLAWKKFYYIRACRNACISWKNLNNTLSTLGITVSFDFRNSLPRYFVPVFRVFRVSHTAR